MKKSILCLLLLSLLLALTGCGGSSAQTLEASAESPTTISTEAPNTESSSTVNGTDAPGTEAPTTAPPTTEPSGTEDPFLTLPETLDDSYSLEDFRFRLSELTPRDLLEQGWVETDAILMRSMGTDNPYAQALPETERKDPNATPELSEEGMLDPDGMVQIYLVPTGDEDSTFNLLRLGVVNTGKETVHYLDCPIRYFSINEALFYEQSEEGHFAAILMDMRMPVMDGLAATREIRKLERPDATRIPIIALTANAFEEDVKACLQAGMDAHMSKPVDIDQLKVLLGRMLAQ